MESSPRLLVLGIGNLLMGDEGVGVHAIRALEKEPLPAGVETARRRNRRLSPAFLPGRVSFRHRHRRHDGRQRARNRQNHQTAVPQRLSAEPRRPRHRLARPDRIGRAARSAAGGPSDHGFDRRHPRGTTELTPAIGQAFADVVRSVRDIFCAEGFLPEGFLSS